MATSATHFLLSADIDNPLNETAADKVRDYRADYNNCPSNSISFVPAVASTSCRLQCELFWLLFLIAHRQTVCLRRSYRCRMGLLPGNRLGHHPFPHRSLYPLTGCNLLPLLWRGCLPALFRFHLVFSSHLRSIIEQSLSPLLSSLLKSIFHERLRHSSPRYVTIRFAPLRCLFSIDVSSCRSRRIPDVLFFLSTGNSPPSFPVSFPLSPGHPPSQ